MSLPIPDEDKSAFGELPASSAAPVVVMDLSGLTKCLADNATQSTTQSTAILRAIQDMPAPVVNVPPAQVRVDSPVTIMPPTINVEQPVVNVAPPAVTVSPHFAQPMPYAQRIEIIERDSEGRIKVMICTPLP